MKALALGLAAAAAAMVVLAFAQGGGGDPPPPPPAAASPAPERAAAQADPGFAVWREQGCGGCHTLAAAESKGFVGPDLGSALKGVPPAIIKRDIVAPAAEIAGGYPDLMPKDFAARIDPDELDALVAYLAANARR